MQNSSPDINVNSGKRKATTDLPTATTTTTTEKKKRMTTPPEGYICNLCQQSGHWIQQCPDRKQQTRKKKKYKDDQSNQHIPIPGVDPSEKDIRDAQKYQLWMATHDPPLCFCQNPSRLKKVKPNKKKNGSGTGYGQTEESSSYTSSYQKRSSPSQQHQQQSRAVGHYFFFCATPRKDGPCRFARLAEQVMKEQRRKDHKKEQEKSNNDTKKEKEEAIGSNQNDDSAVDATGP